MRLRYTTKDGVEHVFVLTDKPVTIGRSLEADIHLDDEKSSRLHCGIRLADGAYHIRDLKSRNHTCVNNAPVESACLQPGDHIRIGSTVLSFETGNQASPGPETIIEQISAEMSEGKGFSTILREIVNETDGKAR